VLQQIRKMFWLMENYKWKKIYSINVVNIFPVICHVWCLCSTNMNMNSGTRTCIITTQSFYLTDFMRNNSFLRWLENYTLITCVGNRRVACGLSSSHTWLFLLVNWAIHDRIGSRLALEQAQPVCFPPLPFPAWGFRLVLGCSGAKWKARALPWIFLMGFDFHVE